MTVKFTNSTGEHTIEADRDTMILLAAAMQKAKLDFKSDILKEDCLCVERAINANIQNICCPTGKTGEEEIE